MLDLQYISIIRNQEVQNCEDADRSDSLYKNEEKNIIKELANCLIEERKIENKSLALLKLNEYINANNFLESALCLKKERYDTESSPLHFIHPLVEQILLKENITSNNPLSQTISEYITRMCLIDQSLDLASFLKFLYKQGFDDKDIVSVVFKNSENPLIYLEGQYDYYHFNISDIEAPLTSFGKYFLNLIGQQSSFLGFKKENVYKQIAEDCVNQQTYYSDTARIGWIIFLFRFSPLSSPYDYYKFVLTYEENRNPYLLVQTIYYLAELDAHFFEPVIIKALQEANTDQYIHFSVFYSLNKKIKNKYLEKLQDIGEFYLQNYFKIPINGYRRYYEQSVQGTYLSNVYFNLIFEQNKEKALSRIKLFIDEADYIIPQFYEYLDEKLAEESLPYIISGLRKNTNDQDCFKKMFEIISKYNIDTFFDNLSDFMITFANLKTKGLCATLLAGYNQKSLPLGKEWLKAKTIDMRISGALLLSAINNPDANEFLQEAVDSEINDETRDIMLENLVEKRFAIPYTLQQVKAMVENAAKFKKLAKWNEKWIEEDKLPKLLWNDGRTELSQQEIRFLLYRMKRAKGLNSDIEARQLLNFIDRNTSGKFAKALISAFQDSNSDTKLKYYLTLAGLLGNDEISYNLNALFNKNISESRMKMAEYVVGALAMVGSNKALRQVDVIYRKYATKKPSISEKAKEALEAAAAELNISMDELSDRIIPDFGFEGLYKIFDVDGQEYRAFISSDFTLQYLNEDNKVKKSLPSASPKELKAEFKDIEKEIRNVVKSQSSRLEKYMIDERRWPAQQWHDFFFMNPIMFVYTLKLVWGVFNDKNQLEKVFYCSEDTSLYDINDEEIILDDNQFVGILHPVYLSAEEREKWLDKIYEMKITNPFPIFERPLFVPDEQELNLSHTNIFYNKKVPKGADFVNTFLVKKNWIKSSGDGGCSEFTKIFRDGAVKAYANIEGPAAFYLGGDTPAKVYEISFMGKNWSDKVCIKDVPPIFYSDVLADIDQLLKTE